VTFQEHIRRAIDAVGVSAFCRATSLRVPGPSPVTFGHATDGHVQCQGAALTQRESHPGAIVPSPRNGTEGWPPESGSEGTGPMRIRERYELAEDLRPRYRGSGRIERGQLLDSFCLATGAVGAEVGSQMGGSCGQCPSAPSHRSWTRQASRGSSPWRSAP